MSKPVAKVREPILDYSECVKYVESILGYKIRDTLGKFEAVGDCSAALDDSVEYRDWWHFLLDHRVIHNPCEITIGSDLLEVGNDWQNEITQMFIDEFGDFADYEVGW